MRTTVSYIRRFLALILLGASLLSCRKEAACGVQGPSENGSGLVNAWLYLNLNVVSSGSDTKSVADDVPGGNNEGIDEDAIKRFVVYLVPRGENGSEQWDDCMMTYIPQVSLSSGDKYKVSVRTRLHVPMNVYVGANLSAEFAGKVLDDGLDAVAESAATAYPEMISEFVSADSGVAMFCTRAYSVEFNEENSDPSSPAAVNGGDAVDLVRMLAKIHVLFQCYDAPNDEFVKITEPGSQTLAEFGAFGWCRLSDISYIVNTLNSKTRLYRSDYGGSLVNYADHNHYMADLLEKGLDWRYKSKREEDFIIFKEDLSAYTDTEWNRWAARSEKFVADRAPFGSSSDGAAYSAGLYCLENTTDDAACDFMSDDEKKSVPFMVTTHVIVKARFVPRKINTVVNEALTVVDHGVNGYESALSALPAVLGVDEDGNAHKYPAGTFFTRDKKEFFDYDGMLKIIALGTVPGLSRKNFACYPGGYGYYYSYIHGGTDSTTGQVTFSGEDSGVFRNHYHILNCRLMKVPAVPGSYNQLMMVNSTVIDWKPKGKMELVVKPNI